MKCVDLKEVQHLLMNWVDSTRLANRDPKAECVMNHGQVEGAMLKVVGQRANKLHHVERLVWPHLVSGELLRLIGGHCAALQELCLACDCQVAGRDEDENTFTLMAGNGTWEDDVARALSSLYGRVPGNFSVTKPTGCPKLRKLILPHLEDENGIAASSLACALCVLPQLEYVSGIPMMSALMKFRGKNSAAKSIKLRNIGDHDLFMRRPSPNVSYLKEILPRLDSIDIIASPAITRGLAQMFPNITTLKIEWPDFENSTKLFSNLVTLDLILDYRGVWQLLRNLGKHCRALKSLTLRQPSLLVSDDHEEGVAPPKFATLEHFHLFRSSFIEFTAFKNLMMGCTNLKKLHLTLSNDRNYIVDELGDALIRNVIPYFGVLESFKIESLYRYNLCMHLNCTLSIDTVRCLIKHCPNISYIGHLDSWDVVDQDIEKLMEEIKQQNLDLVVQ
ncbi:uncharacterized protein LOC125177730 [Hyalella azteca]|uniref:Uncharacterized protein LOC125177730 n=1 Tax=Hyalella azteca TaxID=294128 RepID=A0A979FGE4_HYAAZ|nr:uncharacterized protein LOC125177730 [Hyalella azteca]